MVLDSIPKKHRITYEMANGLGVNIQTLIDQGLVDKRFSVKPCTIKAMIQGGGGKLLELKYPSANVSLHYRPGISLPHKILSQFGIKDNDVTESTIFELCDEALANISLSIHSNDEAALANISSSSIHSNHGSLSLSTCSYYSLLTPQVIDLLVTAFSYRLVSKALSILGLELQEDGGIIVSDNNKKEEEEEEEAKGDDLKNEGEKSWLPANLQLCFLIHSSPSSQSLLHVEFVSAGTPGNPPLLKVPCHFVSSATNIFYHQNPGGSSSSSSCVRITFSQILRRCIMEVKTSHAKDAIGCDSNSYYRVSSEWCQCSAFFYQRYKMIQDGKVHCCKHQLALRIALALNLVSYRSIDEHLFDLELSKAFNDTSLHSVSKQRERNEHY
mmetsp:Transcript_26177/g.36246  ORF Transcript_26177/g.36246 Transcript_26177/m.36246 type:complete len:385 (+) Transcript_26177:528-1682(+)